MKPVPVDIPSIYESFRTHAETLVSAHEGGGADPHPAQLVSAMSQLAGVMRELETDAGAGGDIETLAQYGLQLLVDLSDQSGQLGLKEAAHGFENLSLPLAVWSARRGAEIRNLAPVVNALAYFANHNHEPPVMIELLGLANEVFEAVTPSISEDHDRAEPMRPWRLLLLNRAIIATRTLRPVLMEPVFDSIIEQLPDDAARFFTEGMEQMDIIGYPPQVREIMTRYYRAFGAPRHLH